MAKATGMPYDKAKILIQGFWHNFTKVKEFFDNFVAQSTKDHCVRSPYDGRLRWLDGFDYDSHKDLGRIRNLCMNFPMQSGNASITKRAMVLLRKNLIGKDAHIISTIHDEILVECHKDISDECFSIVKKDMIQAGEEYLKNVPVDVEGKVGTCWEK